MDDGRERFLELLKLSRHVLLLSWELDYLSLYLERLIATQSYQAQFDPFMIYKKIFSPGTDRFDQDIAIMRRVFQIPTFMVESERRGVSK